MSDHLIEKCQKKTLIYKGNYLEYYRDEVLLPNGATAFREYLHHPGAIAAVPVLDNGDVILVRQYRYATGQVQLEIPAGKLEKDELPEKAVYRELSEEIGYCPNRIIHLTSTWTTPGFTDEVIHLYLAKDLVPRYAEGDDDEFLEVERYSQPELLDMLEKGLIVDSKTALALSLVTLKKLW